MKKLVAILLLIGTVFCFASCTDSETNKLISLKKDESLHIGTNKIFKNYETTTTEDVYISCVAHVRFELQKSEVEPANKAFVKYDGYYYYWTEGQNHKQVKLGTKTTTEKYVYSYLPLSKEPTDVMVKTTCEATISYDYKAEVIRVPYEYSFDMNGYFWTISELKTKCPELYDLLGEDIGTREYYAATGVEHTVYDSTQNYNGTYYYVE